MIFGLLKKRAPAPPTPAESMYAAIVAAARRPGFYLSLGVPDSFPGRFELTVLHAALTMRRLRADGDADALDLSQAVFDAMFRALDSNLREIGIGDMAVPKRMKAMARSFFDGAVVYDLALDQRDRAALASALERIVYSGKPPSPDQPRRLADYMLLGDAALAAQSVQALVADGPAFPSIDGSSS